MQVNHTSSLNYLRFSGWDILQDNTLKFSAQIAIRPVTSETKADLQETGILKGLE